MRPLHLVLRNLVGAAALLTFAGCNEPPLRPDVAVSTVSVHPDLGLTATAVAPAPVTETAPPVAIAEDVEPSPNELVKDARSALATGELKRALKLAKLAVLEAPGKSAAWNTLGRAQLRLGQRSAAVDSFAQAVDCNPSSAWAQNNYGLALLYEGNYDEAVSALEEATELAPDIGLMWNNLGMAYEHVDRVEEARYAYKHAIGLDHKSAAQNFVRIEGIRSLRRTAQADPVDDLPLVDDEP